MHDLIEYDDQLFTMRYLKDDDVFVDVGANIGTYTLLGAKVVSQGIVVAFEPHPRSVQMLEHNLALNGCNNVKVIKAAAGSETGFSHLTDIYDDGNRIVIKSGERDLQIRLTTLDNETRHLERISLVKIDTEGYEAEVLKGSSELLGRRPAPAWIVELIGSATRYGSSDRDLLKRFADSGYSPHIYDAEHNSLAPFVSGAQRRSLNVIFIRDGDEGDVASRLALWSARLDGPAHRIAEPLSLKHHSQSAPNV